MSSVGIKCSNSWLDAVGQVNTFKSIKEQNKFLNQENARLRTELHRLKKHVPLRYRSQRASLLDTAIWVVKPAEIIRTIFFKSTLLIVKFNNNKPVAILINASNVFPERKYKFLKVKKPDSPIPPRVT